MVGGSLGMTFFGLETPYKDALPHRVHAPDNTYVDPEYLFKNPFTVKVYPKYVHDSCFAFSYLVERHLQEPLRRLGASCHPVGWVKSTWHLTQKAIPNLIVSALHNRRPTAPIAEVLRLVWIFANGGRCISRPEAAFQSSSG